MNNLDRARKIKLILMDVDGTLTDGTLLVMPDGEELKSYHVRDGMGILMARLAGLEAGIITGKRSAALEKRSARLWISELHQGIMDKGRVLQDIMKRRNLSSEEIAFIGDDLGDLSVIQSVGLSAAVRDAHPRIIEESHFHCSADGGRGAVREFIEFILDAQGHTWEKIEKRFDEMPYPLRSTENLMEKNLAESKVEEK